MDLFNIPDVTISVSRFQELVQKETLLEKTKEYIAKEIYVSKEMLMFLTDLKSEEKENKDNE